MMTEAAVKEALTPVLDPMFEQSIVGYRIYAGCQVDGTHVTVHLEIPTHVYPAQARRELQSRVERIF